MVPLRGFWSSALFNQTMKSLTDMVFQEVNYTDKIHDSIRRNFSERPWLTFTFNQIEEALVTEFDWLRGVDKHQKSVLSKVITTGVKKLIQLGEIKKVVGKLSTAAQWQWTDAIDLKSFKNITPDAAVAKSSNVKKMIKRRAISARSMYEFNKESLASA